MTGWPQYTLVGRQSRVFWARLQLRLMFFFLSLSLSFFLFFFLSFFLTSSCLSLCLSHSLSTTLCQSFFLFFLPLYIHSFSTYFYLTLNSFQLSFFFPHSFALSFYSFLRFFLSCVQSNLHYVFAIFQVRLLPFCLSYSFSCDIFLSWDCQRMYKREKKRMKCCIATAKNVLKLFLLLHNSHLQ